MSDLPLRVEALEAAQKSYEAMTGRANKGGIDKAIRAFCEVEELTVETMLVIDSPIGNQQRLVGSWRDVEQKQCSRLKQFDGLVDYDLEVERGHERSCDTREGGSCDCGFETWLIERAEAGLGLAAREEPVMPMDKASWIAERSDVEKERDELRSALAVREESQGDGKFPETLRSMLDVIRVRGDEEPRGALTYIADMARAALAREDTERPDTAREEMLDRLERGGDIDD